MLRKQNNQTFVQIPSGKWIPDPVRETVRKNPGNLALNTANGEQYYHQYVQVSHLPRKYVIPVFICFFLILLYLLGKLLAARIGRIFLRAAEGFSQLLQNVIEALPFEAEPSTFARRLHELAPKDLGDD